MVKKAAKKRIFKPRRVTINDCKDNIVIKFKNLTPAEVRQLRLDLIDFLEDYLEPEKQEV